MFGCKRYQWYGNYRTDKDVNRHCDLDSEHSNPVRLTAVYVPANYISLQKC